MPAPATESLARAPLLSLAVASSAAVAYEVLLMRLYAIIQWHHFAFLIISLALLGFGASGTFIALFRERLLRDFSRNYILLIVAFGITSGLCFLAAQHIPLNPEEMLWQPSRVLALVAVYLLLAVPFFCVASAVGLTLTACRQTARVYAADLFGAGLGALSILVLLTFFFPITVLWLVAAAGLLASAIASVELRFAPRFLPPVLVATALLPALLPPSWFSLQISPYKGLSQAVRVADTRVIAQRSGPMGLLTVLESPSVPLRYATGLSLMAPPVTAEQLALFIDGDAMTPITRRAVTGPEPGHLSRTTSALPFALATPRRVLVLGAGTGEGVMRALQAGAQRIDAVELNPQVVELLRQEYATYTGGLFDAPSVRVHVTDARAVVAAAGRVYDLITLPALGSFNTVAAGLHALNESYLDTVDALLDYLDALAPGGVLAITRWVRLPPRDSVKMFATAVTALLSTGVHDPGRRLILIRGWQTSTLLVSNADFSTAHVAALREFSHRLGFDLVWYPGIDAAETNRFNVLARADHFDAARALLSPRRADFEANYKFDIEPATDDRPYFSHFFRWTTLDEIMRLRHAGGLPLLESPYLVLLGALLQAVVLSILLIVLPLLSRPAGTAEIRWTRWRVFSYFLALGLAFLTIEMAFLQRSMLFLHHPVYTAATVLGGFLIFAGLGSALSPRLARRWSPAGAVRMAVVLITLLATFYLLALETLFVTLASLPLALKALFVIGLIAPLAVCMGIPFPTAVSVLRATRPALVPWAWGINGCASVISAVGTVMAAMQWGFTWVLLFAVCLYLSAAVVFGKTIVTEATAPPD